MKIQDAYVELQRLLLEVGAEGQNVQPDHFTSMLQRTAMALRTKQSSWHSAASLGVLQLDRLALQNRSNEPHAIGLCIVVVVCCAVTFLFAARLCMQRGLFTHIRGSLQSPESAAGALALGVYLILLVALDLMIKHEAESGRDGHHSFSPWLLTFLVECGKLVVSLLILWARRLYERLIPPAARSAASSAPLDDESGRWAAWSLRLGPVLMRTVPQAALYGFNNCLVLYVLSIVRLDEYVIWRNTAILFNAIISVLILGRVIDGHRWFAVLACMVGSLFNSFDAHGRISADLGVFGVILTAFLSSTGSVCSEGLLKSEAAAAFTIDELNIILYVLTISMLLVGGIMQPQADVPKTLHATQDALSSITRGGWAIVCMNVAVGLAVSRVLKYADAVAKTVVGSMRELVVVFLAPIFVIQTQFDVLSVGSACMVGLAGVIYTVPADKSLESHVKDDCSGENEVPADKSSE